MLDLKSFFLPFFVFLKSEYYKMEKSKLREKAKNFTFITSKKLKP